MCWYHTAHGVRVLGLPAGCCTLVFPNQGGEVTVVTQGILQAHIFLETITIFSSLIQLQTNLHFVPISAFTLQRASDYSASFLPFNLIKFKINLILHLIQEMNTSKLIVSDHRGTTFTSFSYFFLWHVSSWHMNCELQPSADTTVHLPQLLHWERTYI